MKKDGVSEHSIVCFHVPNIGTCNNKAFFFFFPTESLSLLLIKKVSDDKVNHLSSSKGNHSCLILLKNDRYAICFCKVFQQNKTLVGLPYINAIHKTICQNYLSSTGKYSLGQNTMY